MARMATFWLDLSTGLRLIAQFVTDEMIACVGDFFLAMRHWIAAFIHGDKHNPVDRQNKIARDFVAYLATKCQRRSTELGGRNAELDDLALIGAGQEINFAYVFGDQCGRIELNHGVNGRFLVDPTEQAATEKRAIRIQVFRLNPFARVKIHCVSYVLDAIPAILTNPPTEPRLSVRR